MAEGEEEAEMFKSGLQLNKEAEQLRGNYRKAGWIEKN